MRPHTRPRTVSAEPRTSARRPDRSRPAPRLRRPTPAHHRQRRSNRFLVFSDGSIVLRSEVPQEVLKTLAGKGPRPDGVNERKEALRQQCLVDDNGRPRFPQFFDRPHEHRARLRLEWQGAGPSTRRRGLEHESGNAEALALERVRLEVVRVRPALRPGGRAARAPVLWVFSGHDLERDGRVCHRARDRSGVIQ